ncbi:MAG: hypothetical protein ABIH08_06285 [Candidatus Omnitrophota bacterium]
MSKTTQQNPMIDITALLVFLENHADEKELDELGRILKCTRCAGPKTYAQDITKKLYKTYQTPAGYLIKKPTLDEMCNKIAKKMKLRQLQGVGWQRLHSLCLNIFENIFKAMTPEDKEKFLREMWAHLSADDKEKLKKNFNITNIASFIHSSEMLVAHVVGVYLARETALYAAAAVLRLSLGAELTLAASTVLTRTATVFLGPIGWALVAVSINDLMGTDYKRIVPALLTINIINMRVHTAKGKEFLQFLNEM